MEVYEEEDEKHAHFKKKNDEFQKWSGGIIKAILLIFILLFIVLGILVIISDTVLIGDLIN